MNREEILKYLNYHGEYTKEIKKKLKKLLKEYHPDINKSDKKTILILYQIKKELEDDTLVFTDNGFSSENKESVQSQDYSYYILLLEKMIDRLINKKYKLLVKLEPLYEKINFHYRKINQKQTRLSKIEKKIDDYRQYLDELSKYNIIHFITIIFILILLFVFIFNQNIYVILAILILSLVDLYYFYNKKITYNEKLKNLYNTEKLKQKIKHDINDIKNNILIIATEIRNAKNDISEVNGDINFYNEQLNNFKNGEYTNEYENKKNK